MIEDVLTGRKRWHVEGGDCLSLLRSLPDNSIDLIFADPPYFRVKNEAWDRQWETASGFLDWIGQNCEEWHRVLKPNGSLYVCASPKMAARVECKIGERLNVLNHIVWSKADTPTHALKYGDDRFRQFVQKSERIIFAEHYGADNIAKGESGYEAECDKLRGFVFEPLRAYLDGERKRAGIDKADCNVACGFSRTAGGMASRHYFSRSQWCLPTQKHYTAMYDLFNASCNGSGPQHLLRPYEELRGQYEELRGQYEELRGQYEELRRPFSVSADVPYTDVWDFPTVSHYPGKHPCEKPQPLLEHIIKASSREGAVVLDPFLGSGATGIAAHRLGRFFLGFELSSDYCDLARKRISDEEAKLGLWEAA